MNERGPRSEQTEPTQNADPGLVARLKAKIQNLEELLDVYEQAVAEVHEDNRPCRDGSEALRPALAERMNAVARMASSTAHQVNNGLAVILASLECMAIELTRNSEGPVSGQVKRLESAIVDAQEGVERIRKVVHGLSSASFPDTQRRVLVDVRSLLELSLIIAVDDIRDSIEVIREYGEVEDVLAEPARLGHAFFNLLLNAVQALRCRPVGARELSLIVRMEDGRVSIRVRDNGLGIEPTTLPRIFDACFTTTNDGASPGLGLFFSYNVVRAHGGDIVVHSERGIGSEFTVLLTPAGKTTT